LKFLISSDARGEGAFISEIAILDENRPSHTVDRSSKVLSESDWLGRGYRESFESDEALRSFVLEQQYDGLFLDLSIPQIFLSSHHTRIERVMASCEAFVRGPEAPTGEEPTDRGGRNAVYVPASVSP
jgi:hypothetical protein